MGKVYNSPGVYKVFRLEKPEGEQNQIVRRSQFKTIPLTPKLIESIGLAAKDTREDIDEIDDEGEDSPDEVQDLGLVYTEEADVEIYVYSIQLDGSAAANQVNEDHNTYFDERVFFEGYNISVK